MQVAFERGTHYFWSVSKDKMLKYWDGDKVRPTLPWVHVESYAHAIECSSSASRSLTVTTARSGRSRSATEAPLSRRARTTSRSESGRRRTSLYASSDLNSSPY